MHVHTMQYDPYNKLPNLKLKTQPEQLLGSRLQALLLTMEDSSLKYKQKWQTLYQGSLTEGGRLVQLILLY